MVQFALEIKTADGLTEDHSINPILGPKICVAYDILFSFIHRISSLVFVGKAYCYNPIWTSAVTAWPIDVEIAKFILLPFPASLRRFIAPLIPQRNHIFRQRAAVRDLLFPPPQRNLVKEEPSVMKLLIDSGKDTDPESIAARLLLLTAAAVRPYCQRQVKLVTNYVILSAPYILHGNNTRYI